MKTKSTDSGINKFLNEGTRQGLGDLSSMVGTVSEICTQHTNDKARELLGKMEKFIDEIPEAYGWGEADEEADRGYKACSKAVKAEGKKLINLLQAEITPPDNIYKWNDKVAELARKAGEDLIENDA